MVTIVIVSFWMIMNCYFISFASNTKSVQVHLPEAGILIDQKRSDPSRMSRAKNKRYKGPIIDAHVHLDPPKTNTIDETYLQNIIKSLQDNGIKKAIFMPVPNEGHMAANIGRNGSKIRKSLLQKSNDYIQLFCGSEYLTNWLHNAYRKGFKEKEFQAILTRLEMDIDSKKYLGVGEFGLYHFNKNGHQNVIQYSPTFPPFSKIIDLVAKKKVWLDFHAEPVDPNGKSYEKEVFGTIELIFQRYPDFKLIYAHTGMTNTNNLRQILKKYKNIMVHLKAIKRHDDWKNLEPITNQNMELYEDWATLFEEFPHRFLIGTDAKFGRGPHKATIKKYSKGIKGVRRLLGSLNPKAAEMIAYKNALRIFNFDE